MTNQWTILVALLVGTAACTRTTEQAGGASSTVNGWACDDYRGEATLAFVAWGTGIVATSVETGQTRELGRSRTDVRSLAVAGGSVYWADEEGIHSFESGGGKARDLVISRDVDRIATDGARLVYSDGRQLMLVELPAGTPRAIAAVGSRYEDHQHIVVTPGTVYWGNVHDHSNVKPPEQDSLWRVALERGARPVRIASLDILSGYCVGPGGGVVWLDSGPGPAYSPPGVESPRTTKLMHPGGLLAEVKARPGGSLIATMTGFAFTVEDGGDELAVWQATLDGTLARIPVSLPDGSRLLLVERDAVVVELDGKIHRTTIRR
jgi:hypothetical protein